MGAVVVVGQINPFDVFGLSLHGCAGSRVAALVGIQESLSIRLRRWSYRCSDRSSLILLLFFLLLQVFWLLLSSVEVEEATIRLLAIGFRLLLMVT